MGGLQSQQVLNQTFAAHLFVDVYTEGIETLDKDQAFDALNEVVTIGNRILHGGYNELR